MNVYLRVMGQRLFECITKEIAAVNSAFPRHLHSGKPLRWRLEQIAEPFGTHYLENTPDRVSIVLIEATDPFIIDELWAIGSREYLSVCESSEHDFPPAPVILVFDREFPTSDWIETPIVVSDWVSGRQAMHDLARRAVASLRRQKHLQSELGGGILTLNAETRILGYNNNAIQLAASEVPLAELFLAHIGSVIPLEEIMLMMRLAGRSISGSNVRVTIFQLRYKLELLTRNHFVLACAYGEGYALRHARGHDTGHPFIHLEARQKTAIYGNHEF